MEKGSSGRLWNGFCSCLCFPCCVNAACRCCHSPFWCYCCSTAWNTNLVCLRDPVDRVLETLRLHIIASLTDAPPGIFCSFPGTISGQNERFLRCRQQKRTALRFLRICLLLTVFSRGTPFLSSLTQHAWLDCTAAQAKAAGAARRTACHASGAICAMPSFLAAHGNALWRLRGLLSVKPHSLVWLSSNERRKMSA